MRFFAAFLFAFAAASVLGAAPCAAQTRLELPPAPSERGAELLARVKLGALFPIERNDICPGDSECVLRGGGTFGVEVERRWPFGLGVAVSYDAWFVDSGGVFELGVVQVVRAAVRYVFGYEWMVHPSIHLGGGALVFGDTLLVSTVGGAVEVGAAADIELTHSVSLSAAIVGWGFTTAPFTTSRDRTSRSGALGLSTALEINLGLTVLADGGVPFG